MMNLREYFDNILNTQGYDAWCDANNELVDAVEGDEELFIQDEEAHYVDEWAQQARKCFVCSLHTYSCGCGTTSKTNTSSRIVEQ